MEALLAKAKLTQTSGDFPAAGVNYRKVVALNPGIAELWANLGLADHLCGQCQEAVKSFERTTALKSSLFVPSLFLGIHFVARKQDEQAVPYLRGAAALNPHDVQAPSALGRACTALKTPDLKQVGNPVRKDPTGQPPRCKEAALPSAAVGEKDD